MDPEKKFSERNYFHFCYLKIKEIDNDDNTDNTEINDTYDNEMYCTINNFFPF